jgi:hypothetical protein
VPADVGRTARSVPARTPATPPLLVAVRDVADLDGVLQDAAGRAAAEDRPLLVALVAAPPALTLDPVVHVLHARLRADLCAAVASAARGRRRLDVGVVEVRSSRALTRRRADGALDRRLDALARRHHAERHPDPVAPAGVGR